MRRFLKWLLILIVLAVAALFALRTFAPRAVPPKILATAEVKRGDVAKVLEATGIIKAQVGAIVKIGARATGTIKQMNVRVGEKVKKGEIIAMIDDREEQARMDEAQAHLAQAVAALNQVESVYPKRIAEAEANMHLSQAKRDYAQANLARQKKLFDGGLIALDSLDQVQRDALIYQSETLANKASLVRLQAEFEKESIKAQKAIEEAKAVLKSTETKISYTKIISPINGVVANITSQEGETIVAGLQVANLITVLDPSRLEMWIYVDETDVGQIKPGMRVTFRVDAFPDKTFKGEVDQIYPQPEIRDNIVYYQALVRLDPEESISLRPEMTTQCQIVVQEKKDVLVIPSEALKWVGTKQVVYLAGPGGAVSEVQPELGLSGLNETEVVKGLEAGQTVATQIVLSGVGKNKPKKPEAKP